MTIKILVAYASKYGSTAEIAQAIGETLRGLDFEVDVQQAYEVSSLLPYGAVVLGSAVYAGMWRKDAVAVLEENQDALASKPVWLFSSGPTGEGDPVELLDGWTLPDGQREIADRISPQDIAVFHGHIDPDKLNFGERLIIKAVKGQAGDFRDWDAIRAWAQQIGTVMSSL